MAPSDLRDGAHPAEAVLVDRPDDDEGDALAEYATALAIAANGGPRDEPPTGVTGDPYVKEPHPAALARSAAVRGGDVEDDDAPQDEPPRDGEGSGKARWKSYARSIGLDVDERATKEQIIEQVDALRASAPPEPPSTSGDGTTEPGDASHEGGPEQTPAQ